jgi:hypothetical protein
MFINLKPFFSFTRLFIKVLLVLLLLPVMPIIMAAVFQFSQSYGASPTVVDIGDGSGGNYFNFKNTDDATPANYSTYPITAGEDSYEIYIRGHWTGSFNSISNIKFWNSTQALTGYGTGASIKASVQSSYTQPTKVANADSAVPTTSGTALAPTYSSNYSQYLRLQLHTVASGAVPGDGGSNVFSLSWDES